MDDDSDEEMKCEVSVGEDENGNARKKLKTKENDNFEDMFVRDDEFFQKVLNIDKTELTDEEYVKMQIKIAKNHFNIDRGSSEAKKANLGDIKSTKIDSPYILSYPLFDSKMSDEQKRVTPISGNIKAMIPLIREKFELDYEEIGTIQKEKYMKIDQITMSEKRIFGILTAKQVGHIPNVQISFTEDEENFNRDTYMFKSLAPSGQI